VPANPPRDSNPDSGDRNDPGGGPRRHPDAPRNAARTPRSRSGQLLDDWLARVVGAIGRDGGRGAARATPEGERVRRSRLLPPWGACSGCPGSITGARVIDVGARQSEREVGVLTREARGTHCPAGPQSGSAGERTWLPGHMYPATKREPIAALRGALVDTPQPVQGGWVDQSQSGHIDHHSLSSGRRRVEFAVKQRCGGSVKRATEPDDQDIAPVLPAKDQFPSGGRLMIVRDPGGCVRG
jgi:hypothetical protein